MFINELSEKTQEKIIELLQKEEFSGVKKLPSAQEKKGSTAGIQFKKGLRVYQLVSTDLQDREDGLRVDFDYDSFMKTQYEEKTRHSISLKDAVEKAGSVEDGCKKLHWKITRVENLVSKHSPWIAELHTDYIYEVKIGDHMHILVNENDGAEGGLKVYAGTIDALWRMGTIPVSELFSDSELPVLLQKIEDN